jgi:hypothetical protein
MKKFNLLIQLSVIVFLILSMAKAQVPVKVLNGQVMLNDGDFAPKPSKYIAITDTLSKRIKANPHDTTSLFYRELLYVQFNGLQLRPYAGDKEALNNLTIAKDMAAKAVNLKMQNFILKVLLAQIYRELCYRYSADESWMYNLKQIAQRKGQFNSDKILANKYYDEVALLDEGNAYDYQKLKVTEKYPIAE